MKIRFRLGWPNFSVSICLQAAKHGGDDDDEKLELYQHLDKAQGRVMGLEKQVSICHTS
jgi:hypothetical protein